MTPVIDPTADVEATRPSRGSLPPLGRDAEAGSARRMWGLVRLELLRITRGWRWRGMMAVALLGAWWFGQTEMFGFGAVVFFPGGEVGVLAASAVLAVAAVVLGVDAWGAAVRHRASRILESRLLHPAVLIASRVIAASAALLAIATVFSLWPAVGAYRAMMDVLFTPNLLYLVVIAGPLIVCGVSAGMVARMVSGGDSSGIAFATLLMAPVIWFRLHVSDPLDIFLRASLQLGTLVHGPTVAMDALASLAYGLPLMGLAILLVPHVRPATALKGTGAVLVRSRLATFKTVWMLLANRRYHVAGSSLSAAAMLVVAGVPGVVRVATDRPFPEPRNDWSVAQPPAGLERDRIPPLGVSERRIVLGNAPGDAVRVELGLMRRAGDGRLGAISFGPALEVASVGRTRGAAKLLPQAIDPNTFVSVLEFDPPLAANEASTVAFDLRPRAAARRRWAQGFDATYRTFASIPPWWGEPVGIDYGQQVLAQTGESAPFRVDVPTIKGLGWLNRAAAVETRGDRTIVSEVHPDLPNALIAANLVTVDGARDSMAIEWRVFPERRELARRFPVIHGEPLSRLGRAFGRREQPVVLYEVPSQGSPDPLALPAPLLDNLAHLIPFFDDLDQPSAPDFDRAFASVHRGIVSTLVTSSRVGFESPELLRDAAIEYLDNYALLSGQARDLGRLARQDFVFVPWALARPRIRAMREPSDTPEPRVAQQGASGRRGWGGGPSGGTAAKAEMFPFHLRESEVGAFTGPIDAARRPASLPRVPEKRLVAIHHMLRGVMGDAKWRQLVRELFGTEGGAELTMADFRAAAERIQGEELAWFFDQWLEQGIVPRLRVLEVRAVLAENPLKRVTEYRTTVRVANLGSGRVPVKYMLQTEGDPLEGTVWLAPGERQEMTFTTIDRPVDFSLDPEGWIVQAPEVDPRTGGLVHPRVFIKSVQQL